MKMAVDNLKPIVCTPCHPKFDEQEALFCCMSQNSYYHSSLTFTGKIEYHKTTYNLPIFSFKLKVDL